MTEPLDDPEPSDEHEPFRVPITLKQFVLGIFALVAALVLGATLIIAVYLTPIFDRQERDDARTTCSLRANGDVWQAIAATFNTPPTPPDTPPGELTPREKAVKNIQDAADEFDDCR